jgi:hypothetical protein
MLARVHTPTSFCGVYLYLVHRQLALETEPADDQIPQGGGPGSVQFRGSDRTRDAVVTFSDRSARFHELRSRAAE